uniref:Uncharacterized protein n=1 Tax=Glossina pallidipes TaxID=7398 RepID=A0A1B0ACG5_GLOPL
MTSKTKKKNLIVLAKNSPEDVECDLVTLKPRLKPTLTNSMSLFAITIIKDINDYIWIIQADKKSFRVSGSNFTSKVFVLHYSRISSSLLGKIYN